MKEKFLTLYLALSPLRIRKLILPFFSSPLYLFFRDNEAFKLLKTNKSRIRHYFLNENVRPVNQDYLESFNFIQKHGWTMFPGEYSLKYKKIKVVVSRDSDCGLLYVIHQGERLYFKRSMVRKEVCAKLYMDLLTESDIECPHHYTDPSFYVKEDSVLFDIGSAEGIFVLSNIKNIKHAYLFECDPEWMEALYYTFKKWDSKITIIEKYVSNADSQTEISIDSFVSRYNVQPNFIKMDIEGAEYKALSGAVETIQSSNQLCLAVCTYHNHNDADEFAMFFKKLNYVTNFTKGGLLILSKTFSRDLQPPYFRKGVIRAYRTNPCQSKASV